jgi:hypothetical protein
VDDAQRTNTETLSNVIETIHIFVDCLSGITDAWEAFSRTEIALFTRHAQDKPTWPAILTRINRNMSELDRLRKLLLTKRERFRFKLESVSSFRIQTPFSFSTNSTTLYDYDTKASRLSQSPTRYCTGWRNDTHPGSWAAHRYQHWTNSET